MIAIIDYDAGNLRSVEKAFAYLGEQAVITRDPEEIRRAERVVLPGVGAFGDAMEKLHRYGLVDVIRETAASGKPFLGICLGLQLLFESSEESPGVEGLGICKGKILRIPDKEGLKIPHIGWNSLAYPKENGKEMLSENPADETVPGRLFQGIPEGSFVYFVHSYYLKAENPAIVKATTEYSVHIHVSIEQGNVFACQFHPEKSSETGLAILNNFIHVERNV